MGSKTSARARCFFHGCITGRLSPMNLRSREEEGNMQANLQRGILRTQVRAVVGSQQRMRSRHHARRGPQDCKNRAPHMREANRVTVQLQHER